MKVKLLGEHAKNCYAMKNYLNGSWDSPWFYDTYKPKSHWKADAIFRKTKHRSPWRWIELRCNCDFCKAKIVIRVDEIEVLVQELLEEQQAKKKEETNATTKR